VSTAARVVVLPPARQARDAGEPLPRLRLRLLTLGALSLYGVLRWQELLAPRPGARLIGLWALALALAGAGQLPVGQRRDPHRRLLRAIKPVTILLAVLLMFALAGLPFSWVTHLRIGVSARVIGNGLEALPGVAVPYTAGAEPVRLVILLGAALLLLDAALMVGYAGPAPSDLRRALAALPLIVLAVLPSALLAPQLPYVQGLALFALLAAFIWAERLRRSGASGALGFGLLAGIAAMALAPALAGHRPWINYESLATTRAAARIERFDWEQTYSPLRWPHAGRTVLAVEASRPDYWKAEDLDTFDGTAWTTGQVGPQSAPQGIRASARSDWTQTLRVTIGAMSTPNVIAAGAAAPPDHLPGGVLPGTDPGTWTTVSPLEPGDSYMVQVYSPHPSAAALRAAGTAYPVTIASQDLLLALPGRRGPEAQVEFASFGSRLAPQNVTGFGTLTGAHAVAASPYARAYGLARRLERHAATPYAFATAVERYLGHGYTYTLAPTRGKYPLANFLFGTKLGYCQQFAGAMALLLRMGGVPAQVATGFTTGTYDRATRSWLVSDLDAHAWVEAWFPGYGWVRFDPTPPSSLPQSAAASAAGSSGNPVRSLSKAGAQRSGASAGGGGSAPTAGRGHGSALLLAVLLVSFALALAGWRWLTLRRRHGAVAEDRLLAELERAFRRSGRPIAGGVTLAQLERFFGDSQEAAEYIRAIRLARYDGRATRPSGRERRAMRRALGDGLGFVGRARALWALPPRLH
jgi:hypothetical protein